MDAVDVKRQSEEGGLPKAELLTTREACLLLSIGRSTLCRDSASGRIPRPVRIGRKLRWRRRELQDWIQAGAPALTVWKWNRGGR